MHLGIQSDVVILCSSTNNLLNAEGISVYFGPLKFEFLKNDIGTSQGYKILVERCYKHYIRRTNNFPYYLTRHLKKKKEKEKIQIPSILALSVQFDSTRRVN